MDFAKCADDDMFGPAVRGCRGDFDFTIKFEKIFFDIIPASIFIAAALTRVLYLYTRQPGLVRGTWFRILKLAFISVFAALQLGLLAISAAKAQRLEIFLTSSAALTFVASLCMLPLSSLEHSRSLRPSLLINAYVFLTLVCDIAQVRTLWMASTSATEFAFARVFTTAFAIKSLILIFESTEKRKWVLSWDVKEHSPEETAGIFALGAYAWLNRVFLMGYKKILTMDDLFPLDINMGSEVLSTESAKHLQPSKLGGKNHALAWAMLKCIATPLSFPIAPRIALIGFTFCQPFLIETLLKYLQEPAETASKNTAYGLIGATILTYIGIAVSNALYWYFHLRAVYMMRSILANAVYKKTTEAKISATDDSAALTLMSVDVERIIKGWHAIHDFWSNAIEAVIACWLLSRHIGVAAIIPMIVVIISAAVTGWMARYVGPRQKAWMEKIQKRVGLTSNVIGQMKQVKISGLASPVEESIQALRVDELKTGNRFRQLLIISVTSAYVPGCIAPVITFALAGTTLDIVTIFTSISYILLLCQPLSNILQWVPAFIASFTCLNRIQKFLEAEPRVDFRGSDTPSSSMDGSEKKGPIVSTNGPSGLRISGGSFGWEEGKAALKEIDLAIPPSQLTLVVGPVASGKSTLCKVLLGESPVFHGSVAMSSGSDRRIGFCDQVPYLSNATIRENIVGFSPFDQARYNEVIEATLLQPDLAVLPQGDHTNIGSNGITLSGGQKQRVSMARALYLDANFLVFDDILSGLDADTEEGVFRRVFSPDGLLRRRKATVVLCTHSVRHLPSADHIIALGPEGVVVEQGTFQELLANKQYVHSLGIKETDSSSSSDDEMSPVDPAAAPELARIVTKKPAEFDVDQARMVGEWATYKHYFERLDWLSIWSFLVFGVGWGFFNNFVTVWLKFWSEDITSPNPKRSSAFYIGLYGLFQVGTILSLVLMCIVCFTKMILGSGSRLHGEALRTVIRAPLKFFTITDTGVVTNLFSQDMTLIDGELPMSLINIALSTFMCAGMAAVIATASPFLCITYPFLAGMLYVLQKFYLRTSRQMRLLDLEAKSPLYSHFIDTLKGITTFRAFGWVPRSIELNNKLIDLSQRPMYLLAMIQRWLAFVLQMVVAVLAFTVVILATQTRSNTAFTGASLVTLMTFGENLVYLVIFYTYLETSIGAVSRLKKFSDTVKPEEREGEDVVPRREWPLKGGIQIDNVSASYGSADDAANEGSENEKSIESPHLAIKNLSLAIHPGEKVALCGRSGSGKSTVLLVLLRLLDTLPGSSITIDEIPLDKIDRSALRQRIIAVPQDAVFLPDGTSFRVNLDPFNVSTEAECRAVLEAVGLWPFVEERGGLEIGMTAETLSQGQKQLFSLARAVLRRRVRARQNEEEFGKAVGSGGILLLDEVSSSVDQDTEREMRKVIEAEFDGYTIVMVSHRLDAVVNYDRVVVMDKGELVETGRPAELVETEGSRFRELWMVGNGNGGQGRGS